MADTWTIKDILLWSSRFLKEQGCPSSRLDSELLMCQALELSRVDLYCHYDINVNEVQRAQIRESLKRRAAGEPIAYIVGSKEFFGRKFDVNPSVLIPRPETEHLIEAVLDLHGEDPIDSFLDIGTGSGVIAVTLAKQIEGARAVAWDICDTALEVARANGLAHQVSVDFCRVDALADDSWQGQQSFDLICSNPPYIGTHEKSLMSPSVLDFEPEGALFAEDLGYGFYKKYATSAMNLLNEGGVCVLEIGAKQGDRVKEIFELEAWKDVRVLPDLAGLPRVVIAKRP